MLADVTVPSEVLGGTTIAVLGGVGWLLAQQAKLRAYIRQQAGVKDTTSVELSPNNEVTVKTKIEHVPMPEFKALVEYVHEANHQTAGKIQLVQSKQDEMKDQAAEDLSAIRNEIKEAFRIGDDRRSASIGRLHEQLKSAEVRLAEVKQQGDTQETLLTELRQLVTTILQRLPRGGARG
jgi:DNA anti-recombination protein RmuC